MTAAARERKIIIVAGPNGAGKTTFARAFLPAEAGLPRFINADQIAAGLAAFAPETAAIRAGRLMLEEIGLCAARGDSFAFETTLSGLSWLRSIREWRKDGYRGRHRPRKARQEMETPLEVRAGRSRQPRLARPLGRMVHIRIAGGGQRGPASSAGRRVSLG
ncbi:MAG: hypothetical protein LC648_09180 [Novosphingobium sp.]|nr:hypothetical protein [Novosphingobium sp.]